MKFYLESKILQNNGFIESDRYWSLKPAVSNVKNNKVVSGARFVKKNRVMHIEIEEGSPLPEGFALLFLMTKNDIRI